MSIHFANRDIKNDRECLPSLLETAPGSRQKAIQELAESVKIVLPSLDPMVIKGEAPNGNEILEAGRALVPGFQVREAMVTKSLVHFFNNILSRLAAVESGTADANKLNVIRSDLITLHVNVVMSFFPSPLVLEACLLNLKSKLEAERGVLIPVSTSCRFRYSIFGTTPTEEAEPEMVRHFRTILYLLRWYLRCILTRNLFIRRCPEALPGFPYAANIPTFLFLAQTLSRVNICTFFKEIFIPMSWGRVQVSKDPLSSHYQSRARWYVDVCLRLERTVETAIEVGVLERLYTRDSIVKIFQDQKALQSIEGAPKPRPEELDGALLLKLWDAMQLPAASQVRPLTVTVN